jgi:diadenosine tetraphosphatase ApaH/serine/threonine PP2A family protein phosphatase
MDQPPCPDTPDGIRQWIAGGIWGPVPEGAVLRILFQLTALLYRENNLLLLPSPVYIVGNIQGQLYDLLYLFGRVDALPVGAPTSDSTTPSNRVLSKDQFTAPLAFDTSKHFVFLGDYVGRGGLSLNTFIYLACLKVDFPEAIFLLRGENESRKVSKISGFYEECVSTYGHPGPWQKCMEVFDLLPMGALIDQNVFCVHGGLSPELPMLSDLFSHYRRRELPPSGPLADLCWSDPDDVPSWKESPRGAGYLFGPNETMRFTHLNRLNFIARSHQLARDGYATHFDEPDGRSYRLITVWSAPSSIGLESKGAILGFRIGGVERALTVFDAAPREIIPTRPLGVSALFFSVNAL